MSIWHFLCIFIGLSLDCFVVMMQKGATLRNLTPQKTFKCAALVAAENALAVAVGYGCGEAAGMIVPDGRIEISTACLIILAIGIFLMTKAYKSGRFEEKLDKDFDMRKCAIIGFWTSLDTLFLGVGFSFLGISLFGAVIMAFLVTFATVLVAMQIGYLMGAGYQRAVGMSGGAMMIVFSMYIMVQFVLKTLR